VCSSDLAAMKAFGAERQVLVVEVRAAVFE
jgi:hypothetical protein